MRRSIFAVLLGAALLLTLAACAGADGVAAPPVETVAETPASTPTPTPTPTPPPPTRATLTVCGDAMSHMPVTNDAWDEALEEYDFKPIMAGAEKYISQADYAVVNLETVLAGGPKYSGYPLFNTPDALAYSLKDVGFDLLLTANNHSLDQGYAGLERTLDVLDEAGLAHVGTYRAGEESKAVVADVGGVSVAFLGYTYGTNGNPLPENAPDCVDLFNTDYLTSLRTPDTARLAADLERAEALDTDLVAVMVHWGMEYQTEQNDYQEELADLLIANGADLVLGGHSHVPQPMELRTVTAADGRERTGFVAYSLGNFVSAQYMEYTYITAALTLELEKDAVTEEARVAGWSYAPMYMMNRGEEAESRFELLDIEAALAGAPEEERKVALEKALADCEQIFGPNHVMVE